MGEGRGGGWGLGVAEDQEDISVVCRAPRSFRHALLQHKQKPWLEDTGLHVLPFQDV